MKKISLTNKELESIADRIEASVGIPPNPIRYVTMKEVSKAQLKKVAQEIPWKVTTIGEERSVPDKTQIRFIFEDEYQSLLKETKQSRLRMFRR